VTSVEVRGSRCENCQCMGRRITVVDELIPTLDAYETTDGISWVAWCKHCERWHWHGGRGPNRTENAAGHRVAHCIFNDSPYNRSGYCLRYAGEWDELPRSIRKPRRRRRWRVRDGIGGS
jgi:hypothetical protein